MLLFLTAFALTSCPSPKLWERGVFGSAGFAESFGNGVFAALPQGLIFFAVLVVFQEFGMVEPMAIVREFRHEPTARVFQSAFDVLLGGQPSPLAEFADGTLTDIQKFGGFTSGNLSRRNGFAISAGGVLLLIDLSGDNACLHGFSGFFHFCALLQMFQIFAQGSQGGG